MLILKMYELSTWTDYLWHLFFFGFKRVYFFLFMQVFGELGLLDENLILYTMTSSFLSLIFGGFLFRETVDQIMFVFFNYERAKGFDNMFLHDDAKNHANIMGALFFEKFEYKSMKRYLDNKTKDINKCRQSLVKTQGSWWWKEMTPEEWTKKKDKVFPLQESIHTHKELSDLMVKEMDIRDPFNTVQYKLILIPDYSEE
jgi:hypothetical protein